MLKPSFRLYTRACGFNRTIISLDVTPNDYRSGPLELYVTHWFIDVDDFIDYLTASADSSVILIVSFLLSNIATDVLRRLLPQISEVYILGSPLRKIHSNKHEDQHFLDVDSLLNVLLHSIHPHFITHTCYSSERSMNTLTKDSAKHIWYQFFFNILSHLNHTSIARNEMFKTVRIFHPPETINRVLQNCEEFAKDYNSQDVIRWYTRTAFFYAALNRALRSENINHMFAFRYVISDLERSLHELQMKQPLTEYKFVFRGQQMYFDELKSITCEIGNRISMTTFWPATSSFDTSYHCASTPMRPTALLKPVIFVINTSLCLHRSTFVDISHLSSYQREQQLIFPPRSLFRVEGIKKLLNIWYINLTLMDEMNDHFIQTMHGWKISIGLQDLFTLPTNQQQSFFHDLSKENASFLQFQLLIDIILRLDHNDFAKEEMLEICRTKYADNQNQLAHIENFKKTYVEKNAINWYSKDCFLYTLLNQSLRTGNIDLIVKLRYFIQDLHNQLAELHLRFLRSLPPGQRILKLYRGLTMMMSGLETFRQNETSFVSTNSFLSTTLDYQAALFFAGEGKVTEPQVSVVYEISIDTSVAHSVPFADVEYKSIYLDEEEILFSMGAVFRIGKAEEISDRLWKIELTLTPLAEGYWNILTAHLKK